MAVNRPRASGEGMKFSFLSFCSSFFSFLFFLSFFLLPSLPVLSWCVHVTWRLLTVGGRFFLFFLLPFFPLITFARYQSRSLRSSLRRSLAWMPGRAVHMWRGTL